MLHLLDTFCAVADTGSLSKAAERLHVTQPAVTRQIKTLEQELGAVLLHRSSHGVELTPAGRAVLTHARQALAAVDACRRAAAQAVPGARPQLRVAAGHMVMQFLLSPVLAEFRSAHPEVHVELYTGHYQECLEHLTNYTADLALISTPVSGVEIKAVPLLVDPIVAAAEPAHPLVAGGEITVAALSGSALLMLPKQAGFRQLTSHVLAEAGVAYQTIEHPTVEAVKTMAALGMGVALLPLSAVAEEIERGRLAAAAIRDWPDHGRTVLAVTRSEGTVPALVTTLLKALRFRYGAAHPK